MTRTVVATGVLANTVSSHVAQVVLDAAEQSGVGASELAHISSLDRAALRDPHTRIPTMDMHRLWEVLHHNAGREAGIRAAETAAPGRLHVWDYLIRDAPTLATGLRDASRYSGALCDPAFGLRVAEHGAQLTVKYHDTPYSAPVEAIHSEFITAVTLRRAREGFGPAGTPVRVDFAHPAPRDHSYLVKALGTNNIHFDQHRDAITFLDSPPPHTTHHDPYLREILHTYAQDLIDRARPTPSWLETFRTTLRRTLGDTPGRGVTIDEVARRLTLGTRTLQRRLTDHDTTWRNELETARHELALALLHDPTRSVRSIARQLGYRDHRALSRAFHRWTGHTPTTYRRASTATLPE